jgi:hypothetical protein
LTWQQSWNGATIYASNDAVQFNGSSYISLQANNQNHEPDSSPSFWSLLAIGNQPYSAVTHEWINAIGSNGAPSSSQPAFSDISGAVAASQLPTPTTSTLGGIKALAAVSHQWINSIGTTGQSTTTQPADSDLNVVDTTVNDVSTAAHGFVPKAPNDTSQWLRGDGTWAVAGGRLASFTVLATPGSSTYNTPAGITRLLVECVGGGGGGGGAAGAVLTGAAAGGSGGSGSYARKFISSAQSSYSVSVGDGGSGGTSGANDGANGEDTIFGGFLTCNGGTGGQGGASVALGASVAPGGAGGTVSSGGDLNAAGQAGGNGLILSSSVSISSPGGSSFFGGGAAGVMSGGGIDAANYGAGGSGASTQGNTSRAGGSGSAGNLIIWEFQ